jgi:signal transduction histidine kinase
MTWAAVRRRDAELAWIAFAGLSFAAMITWPNRAAIPFHLVWISLILLYGFRVWPLRPTLVVLGIVLASMIVAVALDASRGIQTWRQMFEIPLMAGLFLAMVWHVRRRAEAVQVAEERRSLLEHHERFVDDVSHELRTPVTIARGHLELLRAKHTPAPELDIALDELQRMDAIIERLLLLASATQPDFVVSQELELEPLLEEVFLRWSGVAPRAWRLGSVAPGRLMADPERLRAALDALLENAVKYSEPGAGIELSARLSGRWEVSIEVADEGCGLSPDTLERIFHRFARGGPQVRSQGGVGLGLAITDAVARAHGGRCEARRTGVGSTFALQLPNFMPGEARLAIAPWQGPALGLIVPEQAQ